MARESGEVSDGGGGFVDRSFSFGIVSTLCETEFNHKRALYRRANTI